MTASRAPAGPVFGEMYNSGPLLKSVGAMDGRPSVAAAAPSRAGIGDGSNKVAATGNANSVCARMGNTFLITAIRQGTPLS